MNKISFQLAEKSGEVSVKTVAGSAAVIAADIIAFNGVIHGIDTVV